MKSKCNLIAAFFVFVIVIVPRGVIAEEKTKEYHESWAAGSVQTLEINNKFGEVKINNSNTGEVTIDVVVTVEAANEARANELLGQINVSFGKSGGRVKAETNIADDFKSRQKFSIDYEVNIPSDKNLDVANKYGNTIVGELNASGNFDIKYGNFTAGELNAPESGNMKVNLEYGKGDISMASDIELIVKYSTMNFGDIDDLAMDSKYTVINISDASAVSGDSKYDTFNFDKVESVTATSKYSHFKIGELSKSLRIDAGYGGIKVGKIDSGFESVDITNSYGQVSLGLESANYSLDAECDYCGISYPDDKFEGNRMSENTSKVVKGKVGSGVGGNVVVKSRYGEIKLGD